ncbi:MAG TPA: alpha/beta hydrolase, partial [Geminicoccaceae bacterium]|nr:alpha/beta hydrolase [Geminicoccaceae bacterium]
MELRRTTVEGPDGESYGLAYVEWGDPGAPRTVVCVHGLTRNGRDFDALAAALADAGGMRVICPDVIGRGRSDRLRDPARYGVPTYIGHMIQLLAHLGVGQVDWVGTSMGGLIGMGLAAATAENGPIRRLVLNDVGPFLPKAAVERIGTYVGGAYRFDTVEGLEAHLRAVHAPFGPLTDAQWRHLAEHGAWRTDDGGVAPAYDPAIAEPFRTGQNEDLDLWEHWDRIACPVLVLRGAESDLLPAATAREMTRR